MRDKMLVLENGKTYTGRGFGSEESRIAKLVFNTEMVGYQEVLSDPAYSGNIVVMSYPLVGNYGLTDDDYESKGVHICGFVVREYNDSPSNFRFTQTLSQVMEDDNVPGIAGVDTRELVGLIRDEGEMMAMIADVDADVEDCLKQIKEYKSQKDLVKLVTSKAIGYVRTRNPKYTVVVIDCGMQRTLLKELTDESCNIVIVPYNTPYEVIEKHKPSGILISSGPGDPHDVLEVVETIKKLKGTPMLGVGLGHELIALAYGAKVNKLKAGKRGANISVKNLDEDKIYIVSQNNSFCVDEASLKNTSLRPIYKNIKDGEIAALINEKDMAITSQFMPKKKKYIITSFIKFMEQLAETDSIVLNILNRFS